MDTSESTTSVSSHIFSNKALKFPSLAVTSHLIPTPCHTATPCQEIYQSLTINPSLSPSTPTKSNPPIPIPCFPLNEHALNHVIPTPIVPSHLKLDHFSKPRSPWGSQTQPSSSLLTIPLTIPFNDQSNPPIFKSQIIDIEDISDLHLNPATCPDPIFPLLSLTPPDVSSPFQNKQITFPLQLRKKHSSSKFHPYSSSKKSLVSSPETSDSLEDHPHQCQIANLALSFPNQTSLSNDTAEVAGLTMPPPVP
jgi:hypothetical protein